MHIRLRTDQDPVPWELLLSADPSTEQINTYLPQSLCYLVFLEQHCIGVLVLLPKTPETYEIMNIAVDELVQGKGIGKALIQHAIQETRQRGACVLEVGTGNSSLDQLAFYQKCGFRIVGVDRDFFLKHYGEEIIEHGIRCRDMIRLSMEL